MATTSKRHETRTIAKFSLSLPQLVLIALLGILQGCGADPHKPLRDLSDQEASAARHVFQGITKEQLLAAAEKVLIHAGQGFGPPRVIDTPNGVRVSVTG